MRSIVRGFAAGLNDVADCVFDRFHADIFGKINFDVIIGNFRHFANEATGGDNLIAFLHAADLGLMLFLPLHLRADNQEPEYRDHPDDREEIDPGWRRFCTCARCGKNVDNHVNFARLLPNYV